MTKFRAYGPERQALGTDKGPSTDIAAPGRALAIGAHPDDADFFVSGTFAKWAAAGTDCTYLVLTDGSKGAWRGDDPRGLGALRATEQRRAAEIIGVDKVVMCGHEDGFLVADLAMRREIATWIRELEPDVIATHDPWKPYRLHPDHRAAGFAALDAIATAREPLAYPDLDTAAHRPDLVLLFETDLPDHFESIDGAIQTKIDALLAHESQHESTMGISENDSESRAGFEDRVRAWAAAAGDRVGVRYAEAFKLMPT